MANRTSSNNDLKIPRCNPRAIEFDETPDLEPKIIGKISMDNVREVVRTGCKETIDSAQGTVSKMTPKVTLTPETFDHSEIQGSVPGMGSTSKMKAD